MPHVELPSAEFKVGRKEELWCCVVSIGGWFIAKISFMLLLRRSFMYVGTLHYLIPIHINISTYVLFSKFSFPWNDSLRASF